MLSATVIVAVAGYTAYWYTAAAGLRAALADWTDHRRAAGWSVEIGRPHISGFPTEIELLLQTPRLAGAGGRWRWAAPNIRAVARPWSPGLISVFAPGIHVYSSTKGDFWGEFDRAEAEINASPVGNSKAVIRLGTINLRPPGGVNVLAERATVRIAEGVAMDSDAAVRETGTGVAIDIRSIVLPARWKPALGRELARVSVDAVVAGRIERDSSVTQILGKWRESGGAVEVGAFAIDWNGLILRGEGTFALDRELQPEGAMTADIRGIDRTIDRLIAAGVIDARAAFAAKAANRALSFRGGSAKLPLSVQDRKLYIGPVPLLQLKAVRWD